MNVSRVSKKEIESVRNLSQKWYYHIVICKSEVKLHLLVMVKLYRQLLKVLNLSVPPSVDCNAEVV